MYSVWYSNFSSVTVMIIIFFRPRQTKWLVQGHTASCGRIQSSKAIPRLVLLPVYNTSLWIPPKQYFISQKKESFLKILFIYLFLAALGLHCCARAFSSSGEQGLLFIAVRRLLIAVASLCCRARALGVRALGARASVVAACGLSSCGSWA